MWIALLPALLALVLSQEQEHFLDVKQIVKGTIEAMQRLPEAMKEQQGQMNSTTTAKPGDIMELFKLPADIMKKLAVDAGYMDEPKSSTSAPWIVARSKKGPQEYYESWEEVRKHRKSWPEGEGLVNIKDLFRPLPGVAQPALIQATPTQQFSQIQQDTRTQDPLYRREVDSQGQVHFVPVYPSTAALPPHPLPTPSPFLIATPLTATLPRRIVQSQQKFEAQTFPPPINPFQQRSILPPRIMSSNPIQSVFPSAPQLSIPQASSAPQLSIPPLIVPSTSQIPQPIAMPNLQHVIQQTPVQAAQLEVQATGGPTEHTRKTLLVHPVMRNKQEDEPKAVRTTEINGKILNKETSDSIENDSVLHSEESEPTPLTRKSVINKTALRVRTVEHDAITRRDFSKEEEKPRRGGKSKKKALLAKKMKKIKIPQMDDDPTTTPPTAEIPTPSFEEAMAPLNERKLVKRRRMHASKTFHVGRKESHLESEEKMTGLKTLPIHNSEMEEEESMETITATPRRKYRLWKKQTVRPKSLFTTTETTTTTTTSEEIETGIEEMKKERRMKKKTMEKKKKTKKPFRRTSSPTPSTIRSLEVSSQHCANIRSFARQFGIFDLHTFASRHCSFIENYYAELTCDRTEEYVEKCKKMN